MSKTDPKKLTSKRHRARRMLVQALYQWQMAGEDLNNIEFQFLTHDNNKNVDIKYFSELLHAIPGKLDAIQTTMAPYLNLPQEEIDPVELSILRLAVFELQFRPDIPYKVVINEALELAKTFGSSDGYKFINGVLDKVAANLPK